MKFSKIFRFTLGNRILAVKINAWNQELHTHYGITNNVPERNKRFIPFWDFIEEIPIPYLLASLRKVQAKFGLSDIIVLQTYPKASYRAFSYDEMSWQNYIELLAGTEFIDLSYLKHSVMRNRSVIRITEKDGTKNKILTILHHNGIEDDLFPSSIHHRAFFSAIYPELPKPRIIPKPLKVRLSKYESFR